MRQAADAMSLTAPDMKPWHLKAKYKLFNLDGSVKRDGVFEEWWAAPDRYKISYSGADFNRTDYRSGKSDSFIGSDKMPDAIDFLVSQLMLHPMPYPARLDVASFAPKNVSIANNPLRCLTEKLKIPQQSPTLPRTYCFDETLPMARFETGEAGGRTTWNSMVRFNGHYLAKRIQVSNTGLDPWLIVEVDLVEPQLGIDESAMTPPPDAKQGEIRDFNVIAPVEAGHKISGANPSLPETARGARIEGIVVLNATINKEGLISDIKVVSGQQLLVYAAVEAVKKWKYTPFLLYGQPVEVETTINVVFHL